MGKISYESFVSRENRTSTNKSEVRYFSLKNDGDTAIVRFPYKSTSEFDLVDIHECGEKRWRVMCLRDDVREPLGNCPLCREGNPVRTKFFVKLVEYVHDENGKVVAMPRIWERPSRFAKEMQTLINTYGDLSECVFAVVRHGAKGIGVTYSLMYQPPHVYNEANGYVKDFSAFEGYELDKRVYRVRSKEEMETFISTGDFPNPNAKVESKQQVAVETTVVAAPIREAAPQPTVAQPTPQYTGKPYAGTDPTVNRPRRTYSYPTGDGTEDIY